MIGAVHDNEFVISTNVNCYVKWKHTERRQNLFSELNLKQKKITDLRVFGAKCPLPSGYRVASRGTKRSCFEAAHSATSSNDGRNRDFVYLLFHYAFIT